MRAPGLGPGEAEKAWEVRSTAWNPGTMVTAGDLVFQGRADGDFLAYDAKTGHRALDAFRRLGISAPPVTYSIDGKQYVSILVGWGGAGVGFAGGTESARARLGLRRADAAPLHVRARRPQCSCHLRHRRHPPPHSRHANLVLMRRWRREVASRLKNGVVVATDPALSLAA